MQVISNGKEFRSHPHDHADIKAFEKECNKKGLKTLLVFHDGCDQYWSLRVIEAEQRYYNRMGQSFNP